MPRCFLEANKVMNEILAPKLSEEQLGTRCWDEM